MKYPNEYLFTKDHEWLVVDNDQVTIGITEFAQSELGELVFVDLPKVDSELKAGEVLCIVESTKAASDVYAPISGKVLAVNSDLINKPNLVNSDPHQAGWLVKLEIKDQSELEKLLKFADYENLVKQ